MHFFFDPNFTLASSSITKDELVHFRSLRINPGEVIGITTGGGVAFSAAVVNPATGELNEIAQLQSIQTSPIHLVQAIAKGGRDESALQAAVELGILSATALQAERSISRWDSKVEKNLERWRQIAIAALKQSQGHQLPQIHFAQSVAELKPRGTGIVLDPRASTEFGQLDLDDEVTIVVGPEGGFSDLEIAELEENGFTPVSFGATILRTSTAGPAAIACVKLLRGDYGKRLN